MGIELAQSLFDEGFFSKAESALDFKVKASSELTNAKLLLSRIKIYNGDYEEAKTLADEVLSSKNSDFQKYTAEILQIESRIYGEELSALYKMTVNLVKKIEKLEMKKNEKEILEFFVLRVKIIIGCDIGKFSKVKKCVNRMMKIAKNKDDTVFLIMAWHQKARHADFQGDFGMAMRYYKKVVDLKEGEKYRFHYTSSLHNLANLYQFQGDYQQSVEFYDQEIKIIKEMDNKYAEIIAKTDRAWVYYALGDFNKAIRSFNKTYVYLKQRGESDYGYQSEILSRLIIILSNSGKIDEALDLLEEIQVLSKKALGERVQNQYHLAFATILKSSKQARKRAKAMDLFEKIAFEPILDIEFTLYAFLSLAELYVDDYFISGETEILDDLDLVLAKLYEFSDDQEMTTIEVQADWLNAKIALIHEDMSKAKKLMAKAMISADKMGYQNLAYRISNELDDIENYQEINSEIIQKTMRELNMADNIFFNLKTVGSDDSILFFIMGESGLPLYTKIFTDELEINENLISSFIHAINSFGAEALQTGQTIKRIQYQEYTILIEIVNNLHFVYVLKGKSYPGMVKLTKFIQKFQDTEDFWTIQPDSLFLEKRVIDEIEKIVLTSFI